jgi:hypothetical protein
MRLNRYVLILFILCLMSTSITYASLAECEIDASLELGHQPALKIMDELFNNKIQICFDRTELDKDFSVQAAFKRFRREEVLAFISLSCFNPAKIKDRSHEDLKTIVSYFMKDGKLVIAGASIHAATTTLAFKFSQNSTLTSKQKRLLVENAGPVSGLAVGLIKEILYDARNKDKHTVDARDAIATALGAGFIPRLSLSFDF